MRRRLLLFVAAALLFGAGTALAQTDLTGTWRLQSSVQLPDDGGTCAYSGQTSITQSGATVSGFAELFLVSGPEACPAEMSADLSGNLETGEGPTFVDGTLTGPLGQTQFTGELSPNPGGGGTFDVRQGAFVGSAGTWAAQLLGATIPSLTPVGLTLFTLLLLASGTWFLSRQSA
jgi:hypothetical protein